MIGTVECSMPFISDHHAILSAVLIPRKTRAPRVTKTIRSIKSINISDFCNDILSSEIFKVPVTTLGMMVRGNDIKTHNTKLIFFGRVSFLKGYDVSIHRGG